MQSSVALLSLVISGSLVTAACGSSKDAAPPTVPIDAAAVNALVPAAFKDKVVFEQREVEEERGRRSKTVYTLAAPKSWQPGEMKMFAKLAPPSEDGFGNRTGLSLGSNCDGACEAKDWAKVSEKVNFSQFRTGYKIVKDEVGKASHLMVAEDDDSLHITYAWWAAGATSYHTCSVTLARSFMNSDGPDPRTAAPAFEKACQAVTVRTTDK
ncbi:MAG: hypothetical protein M3680_25705 [Myxococcota bacterium]|nr:hypothetical protein [Myxococcota bacterium]